MKKGFELIGLAIFLVVMQALFETEHVFGERAAKKDGSTITEKVELVTYRTRLFHSGCVSNGCWCLNGQPRKITAYGIDKCVWPHRCDGCGQTNEIYDAQWPKFRREWRIVK